MHYPIPMSAHEKQLADQVLSLSREARAELADLLVESLNPADDGPNHNLWVQEARRRLGELRSGEIEGIPGDEAMAKLRQKYAG